MSSKIIFPPFFSEFFVYKFYFKFIFRKFVILGEGTDGPKKYRINLGGGLGNA